MWCFHAVLPFLAQLWYVLLQCDASWISGSGCHPCSLESILFHKVEQQNLTLTSLRGARELLQQTAAMLLLPLSEHTVHRLRARLTTADSVVISSQDTGGKSAVETAARSAAAESSHKCVCYIQV